VAVEPPLSWRALDRILKRGYLRVAVRDDVDGFGARGSNGERVGREIDLAREIARRLFGDPGRVRFTAASMTRRLPLLHSFLHVLDPFLRALSIRSIAFSGTWWHLGMAGKLPEFLCPRACVGTQDFVGLDYYWGIPTLGLHRLRGLMDAAAGRFDRAPVWPAALGPLLRWCARLQPGLPLLVVENGSVPVADGMDRGTYLRRHVEQVRRERARGREVMAYICWSITSNREWGLPFGPGSDFGLYHIELDTDPNLTRVETPSARVYRALATGQEAPPDAAPP